MSAKATPKAIQLIEEAEFHEQRDLTNVEKVKTAWKCYIPAGIMAAISCASTLCGTHIGLARQAELISLVTAGENMFERYRRKIQDKLGMEGEQEIRMELGKEQADYLMAHHKDYYDGLRKQDTGLIGGSDLGVFHTGKGEDLYWDAWNARYFRCSDAAIMDAVSQFNMDTSFGIDTFFPVNNFYDLLNLPNAMNGNALGFSSSYKLIVRLDWDDEQRRGYKIMTFENVPLSEFRLGTVN